MVSLDRVCYSEMRVDGGLAVARVHHGGVARGGPEGGASGAGGVQASIADRGGARPHGRAGLDVQPRVLVARGVRARALRAGEPMVSGHAWPGATATAQVGERLA